MHPPAPVRTHPAMSRAVFRGTPARLPTSPGDPLNAAPPTGPTPVVTGEPSRRAVRQARHRDRPDAAVPAPLPARNVTRRRRCGVGDSVTTCPATVVHTGF